MASTPYVTTNTLLTAHTPNTQLGVSATDPVGFYGKTPIVQRSLAAQATSLVATASSTAVNSDLKAAIIEIMNTLTAVGLWKGSA